MKNMGPYAQGATEGFILGVCVGGLILVVTIMFLQYIDHKSEQIHVLEYSEGK